MTLQTFLIEALTARGSGVVAGRIDDFMRDGFAAFGPVRIIPVETVPESVEAPTAALTPAYPWLGQVLFGDQTDEAIFRLNDLNGDGDTADAGEQSVFFDGSNASGIESPTGNIFNIHQASDGAVYAADGDTDAVYRLVDLNADGDANDEGEATVWFSEAGNAAGFTLPTPNGVAEDADGAIYIVNAGVSSRPADAIYRTVDLNGDGDANDEGEATVWLDLQSVNATSSAFDLSFVGNVAYLTDTNGGDPDTVYRIEDLNGNGVIDAGEASVFISDAESYGAPIDIAHATQDGSVLTYTWIGNDDDPARIYRLTDLDGSGAIDSPEEAVEVWNFSALPDEYAAANGFSIAAMDGGDIVFTINGGDPNTKNVVRLSDLDGDGDYFDAGETVIALSNALDETIANRPRALAFYSDGTTGAHPQTYVEGGAPVAFASDLELGDADSTVLSGARIEITEGLVVFKDRLAVDLPADSEIDARFDKVSGVLTLAGEGTLAEYEAILRSLTFESRGDDPSEATRHITITVFDERGLDGASATVGTTVGVEADETVATRFGTDLGNLLLGTSADEQLVGLGGNDVINGRGGDDILVGGPGTDWLKGGPGADIFIVRGDSDRDIIHDYDADEDTIVFEGVTLDGEAVTSLEDAAEAGEFAGWGRVEYTFDNGVSLVVQSEAGWGLFA
ncbi:calcium-binding protein [Acuticoccus kandeliae]|uniref:calcium-binding protein n=1 Tax=Acuticoccus kandeliae TaxID=2073160 RepID=UPI000D3EDEB8|nr:hypothetical protein [Acuticoccus kandeliae]